MCMDVHTFLRWVVIEIMGLQAQSDRMLSIGDEWNLYGVPKVVQKGKQLAQKGNLRMDMALMENCSQKKQSVTVCGQYLDHSCLVGSWNQRCGCMVAL